MKLLREIIAGGQRGLRASCWIVVHRCSGLSIGYRSDAMSSVTNGIVLRGDCVQHAGLNFANPGEVVYMEGGETLVQWRKLFFSQYGVSSG